MKFKVGDKVRLKQSSWGFRTKEATHNVGTVSHVGKYDVCILGVSKEYPHYYERFEHVELVNEENKSIKGEKMSLAFDVQNLDLDEDQKLLRKYKVEDNTGALTPEGEQTLLAVLYKDTKIRKTLIDALKKLEEEKEAIRTKGCTENK